MGIGWDRATAVFALTGLAAVTALTGCGSSATTPPPKAATVAAKPPPKDDGQASEGGNGGDAHAAALEELMLAKYGLKPDKQASVKVPLPDSKHWTRVKFWGIESLVGFRYGKEHHAIVGATITHVDDPGSPGNCRESFEKTAKPMIELFNVKISDDPPDAFTWQGKLVEVSSLYARTATLLNHDEYAVAFASYPMPEWGGNSCLIVGIAVPARGEETRARQVRDRYVKEAFERLVVTKKEEPKERY